jgi:hypothetical protein
LLHGFKPRAPVQQVRRRQHPIDAVRRYRKSGEVVLLSFPRIAFFWTVSHDGRWRRNSLWSPGIQSPSGRNPGMAGSFMMAGHWQYDGMAVRGGAALIYSFDTQGLPLT